VGRLRRPQTKRAVPSHAPPPALIPRPVRNGPGIGSSLTPTALFWQLGSTNFADLGIRDKGGREAASLLRLALRRNGRDGKQVEDKTYE
jgi:hypothetical protein